MFKILIVFLLIHKSHGVFQSILRSSHRHSLGFILFIWRDGHIFKLLIWINASCPWSILIAFIIKLLQLLRTFKDICSSIMLICLRPPNKPTSCIQHRITLLFNRIIWMIRKIVNVYDVALALLDLFLLSFAVIMFHSMWETAGLKVNGRRSRLENLVLSLLFWGFARGFMRFWVLRLRSRRIILALDVSALSGSDVRHNFCIVDADLRQVIIALRHLRNVVVDFLVDAWVALLVIAHLKFFHKIVMLLARKLGYLDDVLRVHEVVHVEDFQELVSDFLGEEFRILVFLIRVGRILGCIAVLEFGQMPVL